MRQDIVREIRCSGLMYAVLSIVLIFYLGGAIYDWAQRRQSHNLTLEERVKNLEIQMGALNGEVFGLGKRVDYIEQRPGQGHTERTGP